MLITKKIEIDMGHRVPNHKSKCKNFHGHRYTIEVGVDDKKIQDAGSSSEGMVIDFSDLKNLMIEVIDEPYDHSFTVAENDKYVSDWIKFQQDGLKVNLVSFIPTAENLAQWWFVLLKKKLDQVGIKIKHVKVWETPTSTATYEE